MTTEPNDTSAAALHPLLARLDALEADMARLVEVLDRETAAALAGRSAELEACYEKKLALGMALEAQNEALRAAVADMPGDVLAAILTPERQQQAAAANATLRAALARNEAGLRAATEAVRRIFESAARLLAAEDLGYGPARLPGEGHLFQPRSV
ncbi:hypothetical protein [Benzoatithermus flavus]|uniref:FlgN protein n=1 Tax=Benzoatithermus flavus TaxID=3108223 RepID=A0ABU8XUY8_9PROT